MGAVIKPKKKPVIQKGEGFTYNPATFMAEHHVPFFYPDCTAEEVLAQVKPFEFIGRKFIFFDTETHPYFKSSKDVPKTVVRRWVGTGKKATPQDFPFSIQVCDGTHSFCVYDSVDNDFREFKKLAPLFEDPAIEFVAHNTKFDMHAVQNAGMKIIGRLHDTVVLAKLANENRTEFTLRSLAARANGIVKFESMVDTYKQLNKVADYRQIPKPLLSEYGCADVWNCFKVFVKEYTSIMEEDGLVDLYNKEMEVMIALYAMERVGMRTDASYENDLKDGLRETVDNAEAAVYELAGRVFNMNSTKQVLEVMIEQGVDTSILKYTDKGNVCLDKNELARLDDIYNIPIISKIQEYKKAEKLLTTYAVGIYDQVDQDGVAHGSINQTEAVTGRMSITKPALQTLPKKDKRVRKMFIPPENHTLYFMDLDQVEYRLFAHYAKADGLIEAINAGHDVHAATGALIYHKNIANVTDDERARAKTLNFALT